MLKQNPPPRRELSRSSEHSGSRRLKKPVKDAKRRLSAEFSSVTEDSIAEASKELIENPPVSEFSLSDINQNGDMAESFLINPELSPSSETFHLSEFSAPSLTNTDKNDLGGISVTHRRSNESDGEKNRSMKAKMIINFLKQARTQVLYSGDLDPQSKQILDALNKIGLEKNLHLSDEKVHAAELVLTKKDILTLLIWIIFLTVIFFFSSGISDSFTGPKPT